jgi:hypothetical protein
MATLPSTSFMADEIAVIIVSFTCGFSARLR